MSGSDMKRRKMSSCVKRSANTVDIQVSKVTHPEIALMLSSFTGVREESSMFDAAMSQLESLEKLVKCGQSSKVDVDLAELISTVISYISDYKEQQKKIDKEDTSQLLALCDEAFKKMNNYKVKLDLIYTVAQQTKQIFSDIDHARVILHNIMQDLRKRHADLETQIKNLQTQTDNDRERIVDLETNVENLTKKVDELEKRTQTTDTGLAKLVLRQLFSEVQTRMSWIVFPEQKRFKRRSVYYTDLVKDVEQLTDVNEKVLKKQLLGSLEKKYKFNKDTEDRIKRLIRGSNLNDEAHPELESSDFIQKNVKLLYDETCIDDREYQFCLQLIDMWSNLKESN